MTACSGYEGRIGRYCDRLAQGLVDVVDLPAGARVLELGCGSGPLTRRLAAAVGTTGVTAVDADSEAVAVCRERVPGADARVADAEALPFPDDSFDAVLAQLLVHLVDDPLRVAGEMRRVARPGAHVATCVWDFAAGMTPLRAFWDSALQVGAPDSELRDQRRYRLATPAELASLWAQAGLRDVVTGALETESLYAGFADLWDPLTEVDGSPGRYLASLEAGVIAAIRSELRRRLGSPEGSFTLTALAWYVRGTA